ncbi:MAG: c-type cytochrome domain-containing protein [Pirellulales bacterium]|nr:c-type cytochrome domain-containing protein [Pirellulales bacterium]
MKTLVALGMAFVAIVVLANPLNAGEAEQATALLRKYCYECHGTDFAYPSLDILDRATLIEPKSKDEKPFLVPGDAAASRIFQRLTATDSAERMPPEDQPQPTAAEKELIGKWIAAGAEFPAADRPARPYKGEDTILAALAADLEKVPAEHRQFTRYFTLLHLWNNPAASDHDLRLVRAAVSKLINSLSKQVRITPPRVVDADGLLLAIDLRDYGWDKGNRWNLLIGGDDTTGGYPYGLSRGSPAAKKVYDLAQSDLPYVRADWFVYNAARPALYYALLGLPQSQKALEEELGVNARENLERDRTARAAFRESGVSDNSRMVQRQEAKYGAYWDSFDNATDGGDVDFFIKPLGPIDPEKPSRAAFKHDGGEVIFHLPNGLLAFYLATDQGAVLNEGPINIVRDPQQFSGSNKILNGISCFGCHRQGFIPFTDTLREGYVNRQGESVADKVLKIFPVAEVMERYRREDSERYQLGLDKATLQFLRTSPEDKRSAIDFPEPITHVSRHYDRKLTFDDIARELLLPADDATAAEHNIPTVADLKSQLKLNAALQNAGLEPITRGEVVPRSMWEKAYHRTARVLRLGVPVHFGN